MFTSQKDTILTWFIEWCPPMTPEAASYFECRDVVDLIPPPSLYDFRHRQATVFYSREHPVPSSRREFVVMTRTFAKNDLADVLSVLRAVVRPALLADPEERLLVDADLRVVPFGRSATHDLQLVT